MDQVSVQEDSEIQRETINVRLPKFNITLPTDNTTIAQIKAYVPGIKVRKVIQHPAELIQIENKISKVYEDLENQRSFPSTKR